MTAPLDGSGTPDHSEPLFPSSVKGLLVIVACGAALTVERERACTLYTSVFCLFFFEGTITRKILIQMSNTQSPFFMVLWERMLLPLIALCLQFPQMLPLPSTQWFGFSVYYLHHNNSDDYGLRLSFFYRLQKNVWAGILKNLHTDLEIVDTSYILDTSIKLEMWNGNHEKEVCYLTA